MDTKPTKGGRPPGVIEALHRREGRLVTLIGQAIELFGEDNPAVVELLAIQLAIARGEPGFTGRHTGTRLKAAEALADRLVGKATQRVEVKGHLDLAALVGASMEEGGDIPPRKPALPPGRSSSSKPPVKNGSPGGREAPSVALSQRPGKPFQGDPSKSQALRGLSSTPDTNRRKGTGSSRGVASPEDVARGSVPASFREEAQALHPARDLGPEPFTLELFPANRDAVVGGPPWVWGDELGEDREPEGELLAMVEEAEAAELKRRRRERAERQAREILP